MIKKVQISLIVLLYVSLYLTISACASDFNTKKVRFCVEDNKKYFECDCGDQKFILCENGPEMLQFFVYNKGKLKDNFIGKAENDFYFSNYHRFKVNQNTVSFKSEYARYEVFEYIDEDSKSKIEEYGVTITPIKDSKAINVLCEGQVTSNLSKLANVLKKKPE